MPKINPNVLRWARETAGLSPEEACKKLSLKESKTLPATQILSAIESGEKEPSKFLLEKMEKHYHRSITSFYLPYIPLAGNRGEDFRTLHTANTEKENALVDALIRDIYVRQSIIKDSLSEEEENVPEIPIVGHLTETMGVNEVVSLISRFFKIDIDQFYNQLSFLSAFNYLRGLIESQNIFVLLISNLGSYHTRISLESFRGFSIADKTAPFIVLNDQDSKAALSFTLLHEVVHICLGQTGISNNNPQKNVERFCDQVASEILLPSALFGSEIPQNDLPLDEWKIWIEKYSQEKKISNTMVAYRLAEAGRITFEEYFSLQLFYRDAFLQSKVQKKPRKASGPDYYQLHRYQIGGGMLGTIQRLLNSDNITSTNASRVLGIKIGNMKKLLSQ
jgi:Zn-dependent peptidase ImmA (M78 family)